MQALEGQTRLASLLVSSAFRSSLCRLPRSRRRRCDVSGGARGSGAFRPSFDRAGKCRSQRCCCAAASHLAARCSRLSLAPRVTTVSPCAELAAVRPAEPAEPHVARRLSAYLCIAAPPPPPLPSVDQPHSSFYPNLGFHWSLNHSTVCAHPCRGRRHPHPQQERESERASERKDAARTRPHSSCQSGRFPAPATFPAAARAFSNVTTGLYLRSLSASEMSKYLQGRKHTHNTTPSSP